MKERLWSRRGAGVLSAGVVSHEFLESFEERIGNRKIRLLQIMTVVNCSLDLVRFKGIDAAVYQFAGKGKYWIQQPALRRGDCLCTHGLIR